MFKLLSQKDLTQNQLNLLSHNLCDNLNAAKIRDISVTLPEESEFNRIACKICNLIPEAHFTFSRFLPSFAACVSCQKIDVDLYEYEESDYFVERN